MHVRELRVLANPWLHIHVYADGRPLPAGAVGVDMVEHVPAPNRYVGARPARAEEIQAQKSRQVGKHLLVTQPRRTEIYWEYSVEPEKIPNTAYYREQLKLGTLFAADKATAGAAGIEFVEPKEALEAAKVRAIENFDAANGENAFALMTEDANARAKELEEARAKAEAEAKPEAKSPEPTSKPKKKD